MSRSGALLQDFPNTIYSLEKYTLSIINVPNFACKYIFVSAISIGEEEA